MFPLILSTSLPGSLIFPSSLAPRERKNEKPWERGCNNTMEHLFRLPVITWHPSAAKKAAKWSEDTPGRRLKNFLQIFSMSSVDIAYSSQSWLKFYWRRGVCNSSDMLEPNKIQAFRFFAKLTQNLNLIAFDEDAESECLAGLQNTWLKDLLNRLPYSVWFIQIFWSTAVE